MQLTAGVNKVRLLASGQSGPNVDALTVTPVPSPVVYQAEAALLSGAKAASDHAGFTGSGFSDYRNASGDFVEFVIDLSTDGVYALDFRYANGGTRDRPLDLGVDGTATTARLAFAPTGGWDAWNTASHSVLLTAGRHTIRLTATGLSGPNLDALTVRAVGAGQ